MNLKPITIEPDPSSTLSLWVNIHRMGAPIGYVNCVSSSGVVNGSKKKKDKRNLGTYHCVCMCVWGGRHYSYQTLLSQMTYPVIESLQCYY